MTNEFEYSLFTARCHYHRAREKVPQGVGTRPVYQRNTRLTQHSSGDLVFAQDAAGLCAHEVSLEWDDSRAHATLGSQRRSRLRKW